MAQQEIKPNYMIKKLITLLLIGNMCMAQSKGLVYPIHIEAGTGATTCMDTVPASTHFAATATTALTFLNENYKLDTIPSLILMVDTAHDGARWSRMPVFCEYGYTVVKINYNDGDASLSFDIVGSLQNNKQPFPKTYIIWDQKPVKK